MYKVDGIQVAKWISTCEIATGPVNESKTKAEEAKHRGENKNHIAGRE